MSAVSGSSEYRVLDSTLPRQATDAVVARVANGIRDAVMSQQPHRTGALAGGWHVTRLNPSVYLVANDVPYGRYVEYGTRSMPARPVFGQVIAQVRAQVSR
jgi:HK97 gp10 family phage protein